MGTDLFIGTRLLQHCFGVHVFLGEMQNKKRRSCLHDREDQNHHSRATPHKQAPNMRAECPYCHFDSLWLLRELETSEQIEGLSTHRYLTVSTWEHNRNED